MNRVKIAMLTSSMMTPAERRLGRFMRAPDHPGGDDTSADSGVDTNNKDGNSGDSGTPAGDGDNSGQPLELDQFWEAKPDTPAADDSATKQQSQAIGQELGGLIKSFKGPEVFTKEIADKIADGDLAGVNEAFAARDQAIMNHSVVVTAKLLGGVVDQLSKDFDQRIQAALGQRDNTMVLETQFPLAKDPAMKPMVQRVWDQALVNAKGNQEQAIRLTRGMLEAFGNKTSIRDAPADPTAGINTPASKSLVASLLER